MKKYIFKKSNRKGKRFVLIMTDSDNKHHFGSSDGKTYIDDRTAKEKEAWKRRHSVDKNYNNKHSGIYWSKNLLWNKETLKESITDMEDKLNVKIINEV